MHKPLHPFVIYRISLIDKLMVYSAYAISPLVMHKDILYLVHQRHIFNCNPVLTSQFEIIGRSSQSHGF